jgi:thioredoxin reductase
MSFKAAVFQQLLLLSIIGYHDGVIGAEAFVLPSFDERTSFTRSNRSFSASGDTAYDPFSDNRNDNFVWDVIIAGGSAAGLSAALSLGRSLRHVLVVDGGQPCNRHQVKSHNLLGMDGVSPAQIAQMARANVEQYETIQFWDGAEVQKVTTRNENFAVTVSRTQHLSDSDDAPQVVTCRKLILATGMADILPPIPGLQECWGKTVIHCPYCHGYEFRHKSTALWMPAKQLWQMAPIVRTITNDLSVVGWSEYEGEHDIDDLWQQLTSRNITVYNDPVVEIHHDQGIMTSLRLQDGTDLPVDALYIRPSMQQNFQLHRIQLEQELLLDDKGFIQVDADTQKTSIEGIMGCGDCTTPNRALSIAIASGTRAAKMLNYELSMEDWERAA